MRDILVLGNLGSAVFIGIAGIGASVISGNWIFAGAAFVLISADLWIKYNTIKYLVND